MTSPPTGIPLTAPTGGSRAVWGWIGRGAALVALTVLLLTGCSLPNPLGPSAMGPPLSVLARDAVAAYDNAPAVHVQGSYQVGSVPVTVRVALQPSATGQISGQATYGSAPLTVVGGGGHTFTKGVAYWQAEGAQGLRIWPKYGAGWVLAPPGDPGAKAVDAARTLGGLVPQLGRQAAALRSQGTSELEGHAIASLQVGPTTYDITTSPPYRLLAVRRAGSSPSPTGLRRVNLQVGYGDPPKVALPASGEYLDPRDAATFPALYEVRSMTALQSCDQSSCGFTATLVNTTGPEQGQLTATLALYQDAQFTQLIGSCTAPVPQVATGQTTTVSCRITDPSYQSFYASLTTGATVYRQVTLQNPPYD